MGLVTAERLQWLTGPVTLKGGLGNVQGFMSLIVRRWLFRHVSEVCFGMGVGVMRFRCFPN